MELIILFCDSESRVRPQQKLNEIYKQELANVILESESEGKYGG